MTESKFHKGGQNAGPPSVPRPEPPKTQGGTTYLTLPPVPDSCTYLQIKQAGWKITIEQDAPASQVKGFAP